MSRDPLAGLLDGLADRIAERINSQYSQRAKKRADAADYLGVSVDTIDELHKSGDLPKVRIRGSVLFDVQDLDRLIEAGKER